MILQLTKGFAFALLTTLGLIGGCDRSVDDLPEFRLIRTDADTAINPLYFPEVLAMDSTSLYNLNYHSELVGIEAIFFENASTCYRHFTRIIGAHSDLITDYYLKQLNDSLFYLVKSGFGADELNCDDEGQLNSWFFEYQEYKLLDRKSLQSRTKP